MGNTILSWKKVDEIRMHHRIGGWPYSRIAKEYGISKGHVSEIINGKIWIEGKHYSNSKNMAYVPNQTYIVENWDPNKPPQADKY
jgi:hypothetical protein